MEQPEFTTLRNNQQEQKQTPNNKISFIHFDNLSPVPNNYHTPTFTPPKSQPSSLNYSIPLTPPVNKKVYTCNIDSIIDRLTHKSAYTSKILILEDQVKCLLRITRDLFLNEPSLVRINAPVSVCGDLHGQFIDLLRIFQNNGKPSQTQQYVFLGDYVDRGIQSTQTMCLLLAYKIRYPKNVVLLRGNHETASLNKVYGFYNQCCRKYSPKLWKSFVKCFNCMPVAALISNRILCMHGGLSPAMIQLSEIQQISRPCDVGTQGLLCDLLWSDPEPTSNQLFGNSTRGAGFTFGRSVVDLFCKANDIDLIVRAHQIVEDGYEFSFNRQVLTIFSAPNYCNKFTNDCAILKVDTQLKCSIMRFSPQKYKTIKSTKQQFAEYQAHQNNHNINQIQINQQVNDVNEVEQQDQDSVAQIEQKKTKKIHKILKSIKQIVKQRRQRSRSQEPHSLKYSNVNPNAKYDSIHHKGYQTISSVDKFSVSSSIDLQCLKAQQKIDSHFPSKNKDAINVADSSMDDEYGQHVYINLQIDNDNNGDSAML